MIYLNELIYGNLPIAILFLWILNSRINQSWSRHNLLIAKWIIISLGVLNLLDLGFQTLTYGLNQDQTISWLNRDYTTQYVFFSICSMVLPFILLFQKTGSSFLLVFLVSIFSRIGVLIEKWFIIITSLHRDYMQDDPIRISSYLISSILMSIVIAFTIAAVGKLIGQKNQTDIK
ncbi:MAG: hypothetical protein CL840_11920 [Crocinitomicaceae bacterium]|nr:hypothetical protein [Crocinitomicaceae bacterium]|tara:strand:- start:6957 stop:7481 length:525 start_codon:yes stop_codon:yes gene_type:complete